MIDKKALTLLKKFYLPYKPKEQPSQADIDNALKSGVLVPDSAMTHDEIISEIKALAERLSLESAAKAFLYSLSSGDMRYRSAVSSLIWARALPVHELRSNGVKKTEWRTPACVVCGCTHGFDGAENIDWNKYGVFRYLPPKQYGREPDYTCAEYVLNDLRGFEKLPAVEPCDEDYRILNGIFACVGEMKPHNMDTALLSEIHKRKFFDATGNAIHCILAVLSVCGILEGAEHKGFLHSFANFDEHGMGRDGLNFYPLGSWRGRDGVNYKAVEEVFGSFAGDKLNPEKAVLPEGKEEPVKPKKNNSQAEQYFTDGVYCITLTNEERRYFGLDPLKETWEKLSFYSVTYQLKKRTVLFFDGNTIVKVIYEDHSVNNEGEFVRRNYTEFDTRLETDNRKQILPLTARGRAKPVTPTNVMAVKAFGCEFFMTLEKDKSYMRAWNSRNHLEIPIGETKRIHKITCDEDLHQFMKYYMSTCPEDYFELVDEVRNTEHQTVRFKPGDIFRCQEDRTHYTYGIILGKTREIEKWAELPKVHSFRTLMDQPLIIRMYDFRTTDRDMTADTLSDKTLRPPEICADADILWGTHKIVSHKELTPDDIQFHFQLARQRGESEHFTPFTAELLKRSPVPVSLKEPFSLYVEWGFTSFELPWDIVPESIREMLDEGVYFNGGVSLGISGYYCGKTLAQILKDSPRNLIQYNLLLPENHDKFNMIMDFLELPHDCTLDEFAEKFGGISRQKYIELVKERSK